MPSSRGVVVYDVMRSHDRESVCESESIIYRMMEMMREWRARRMRKSSFFLVAVIQAVRDDPSNTVQKSAEGEAKVKAKGMSRREPKRQDREDEDDEEMGRRSRVPEITGGSLSLWFCQQWMERREGK